MQVAANTRGVALMQELVRRPSTIIIIINNPLSTSSNIGSCCALMCPDVLCFVKVVAYGLATVSAYMGHIQAAAEGAVRAMLRSCIRDCVVSLLS